MTAKAMSLQETAVHSTPADPPSVASSVMYSELHVCGRGRGGIGDITEQKPSVSTNRFSIVQASVSRHLG